MKIIHSLVITIGEKVKIITDKHRRKIKSDQRRVQITAKVSWEKTKTTKRDNTSIKVKLIKTS